MDMNKPANREMLGLMFMLGGMSVIAVALIIYFMVDDLPDVVVYLLIMVSSFDIIFGMLVRIGKVFKNIPSKYDIQRQE